MKKMVFKFYFLCFIFLLFFSNSFLVHAESYDENHLIYNINSFNISGGNLKIEGFAFIDHMNNFGGENLKIYIIARSGDKSKEEAFEVDKYNNVNSDGIGGYDYYYARCQQSASGVGSDYCSSSHAVSVRNDVTNDDTCNQESYSDCAYFNVNFSITISINKLIDLFGTDGDITFHIKAINKHEIIERPLGVHERNCSNSSGVPGSCNGSILADNGTITVTGLSKSLKVTTTSGKIREYPSGIDSGGKYDPGQELISDNFVKAQQYYKHGNPFKSNIYVVDDNKLVYDSWVEVAGNIVIKFDDVEKIDYEYSCLSGYSPGSFSNMEAQCDGRDNEIKNCKKVDIGSLNVYYKLTDEQYNAANVGKKCVDSKYVKVSIETKVPTKGGATTPLGVLIHQKGVFNFGVTNNSVYAGRGFKFPKLDYTNTFFGIYNIDIDEFYKDGFKASWPTSKHHVTYKINPLTGEPEIDANGNFIVESSEYLCDGIPGSSDPFNLDYDEKIYRSSSGGGNISVRKLLQEKASEKMKPYVNDNNVEQYKTKKPESYESNGKFTGEFKEVEGIYNESQSGYNKSEYEINNIVGVSNSDLVSSHNDGEVNYKYITKLSYDINDPYIKLTENGAHKMGEVFYGPKPDDGDYQDLVADHYFVSLYFPQDEYFKIRLKNTYLSFIKDMEWSLDGICYIDVINKVYDVDDGHIKPNYIYRPISLSDPFPDGKIPINWSDWWKEESNRNRIYSTYNKGLFYGINLTLGNSIDGYLGTKSIEISDYNSWEGISKDGKSDFILDKFNSPQEDFVIPNVKSWCNIGEFKPNECDEH